MDVFTEVREGFVDEAMAFEEAAAPEALGDDNHRVVPPVAGPGMPYMLERVVRDQKFLGRERVPQAFPDGVLQAHGNTCRKGRTTTSSRTAACT